MSQKKRIKLLYIDNDQKELQAFKATFRRTFDVTTASSVERAFQLLNNFDFHLVIAGYNLDDKTGIEFLREVKVKYPYIPRILATKLVAFDELYDAVNKSNIFKFLYKPLEREDVVATCIEAYREYQAIKSEETRMLQLEQTNAQLEFMLRQKLIS